jgi:hypothetical protein
MRGLRQSSLAGSLQVGHCCWVHRLSWVGHGWVISGLLGLQVHSCLCVTLLNPEGGFGTAGTAHWLKPTCWVKHVASHLPNGCCVVVAEAVPYPG